MADRAVRTFMDGSETHSSYEEAAESTAEESLVSITSDLSSTDTGTLAINVRDANPEEDLGSYSDGPAAVVTPNDPPSTPTFGISTGTGEDAQYNSWYAFENDVDMEDKTAVLYGFQFPNPDDSVECMVSQVRIDTENAGRIGSLDLTSIQEAENNTLIIEDPLVITTDDFFLEAYVKSGFADTSQQVKPLIKVAEEPSVIGQSTAYARS